MVFVFPETGMCVTNVTKLPWIIATGRDNVTNVTKLPWTIAIGRDSVTNVTKHPPGTVATGRDNVTNVTKPSEAPPQCVTRDKRDKTGAAADFFGNIF